MNGLNIWKIVFFARIKPAKTGCCCCSIGGAKVFYMESYAIKCLLINIFVFLVKVGVSVVMTLRF